MLMGMLASSCMAAPEDFRWTGEGLPEGEMEIPIRVPLNEIMVLDPYDGDVLKYKDLKLKIASGYGVLTFVSVTVNRKLAVPVKNIEAGQTGVITVPKKHFKIGKNRILVNSWHQMPGQTTRLEKFKHPEIRIKIVR
jgi:hypothetical protein